MSAIHITCVDFLPGSSRQTPFIFESIQDAVALARITSTKIWAQSPYETNVIYEIYPGGRSIRHQAKKPAREVGA